MKNQHSKSLFPIGPSLFVNILERFPSFASIETIIASVFGGLEECNKNWEVFKSIESLTFLFVLFFFLFELTFSVHAVRNICMSNMHTP